MSTAEKPAEKPAAAEAGAAEKAKPKVIRFRHVREVAKRKARRDAVLKATRENKKKLAADPKAAEAAAKKKEDAKARALQAAKASKAGKRTRRAKKVRKSVHFRRPRTLRLPKNPAYPRVSVPHPLNKMDHFAVLKHPLTTESAMKKIEDENTLVFIVDLRANKHQISDAVRKMYAVKPVCVRTLIRPDGQKKAYVRLPKDTEAIDVASKIGII